MASPPFIALALLLQSTGPQPHEWTYFHRLSHVDHVSSMMLRPDQILLNLYSKSIPLPNFTTFHAARRTITIHSKYSTTASKTNADDDVNVDNHVILNDVYNYLNANSSSQHWLISNSGLLMPDRDIFSSSQTLRTALEHTYYQCKVGLVASILSVFSQLLMMLVRLTPVAVV